MVNKDTQWDKDRKAAYESEEFGNFIKSQPKYEGFVLAAVQRVQRLPIGKTYSR